MDYRWLAIALIMLMLSIVLTWRIDRRVSKGWPWWLGWPFILGCFYASTVIAAAKAFFEAAR
jgi:hypothetical protein